MDARRSVRNIGLALVLMAALFTVDASARGGYHKHSHTTRSHASGDSSSGYINSKGEWVPPPTHTPDGKAPKGASARCADGSYSFSHSRRGTCSHHGGVATWQPSPP